jgi:NitT/TauT family transport system substrate-binding protein
VRWRRRARSRWFLPSLVIALLGVALLPNDASTQAPDKVTLQLKWVTQAQFAGYYAAKAKGFYAAEKLDVTIRPGGPDIVPEQVVAGGGAQFGIDWLPSLLAARDQGAPLTNIAQVFAHSGMREIAFKTSGIKGAADLRGRKVAVWFAGNEFELLVVIDFNREGTAMLEDGIFTRADWLGDAKNKAVAARVLRASLKGWEACRDQPAECVEIVLKESPLLGREHQTWMMTEINKLVWGPPAPKSPLGKMDPAAFKQTADIALRFGVIKKPADAAAYTHEIWELARKK